MDTTLPDCRIAPPRLSPGVLAAVVLLHCGVLGILLFSKPPSSHTPPETLFVRLIEPSAARPEAVPPPEASVRPVPPPARASAAPVPASPPAQKAETPGPETPSARPDIARLEPQPRSAPVAAPPPAAPASVPAPVASEAPRPAPAAPPLPVTQPRFNAEYRDNPKPPYPGLSRRMGEEGEVRLRVYVDANGIAQQVELYRSSGFSRLDQSALDTVRQWRFVPARQGDEPVAASVIVPILFSLRS
ncbi:MAG: energy transducer TonB [Thiobacillus sp.]|nr:energy transducer TonB [Thiobacillus sp.]